MRGWMRCAAVGCLAVAMCCRAQGVGELVVTLVGTGGPELTTERSGIATLLEVNHERLLFDAGRGTLEGLYRAQVAPQGVTRILLTHLHSDHIVGLADLWITPWFLLGRKERLEVWGPVGTQAMVDGMRQMYAHDVEHRANPGAPRVLLDVIVHEIASGDVVSIGSFVVTATAVEHADGDPAFAYRVEENGRSVLLTGDCTLTPPLIDAARGADVVIANVAAGTAALEAMPRWRPVFAKLLMPEQAAQLLLQTKPRMAVYSHIVKKGLPGAAGDAVILRRTRAGGYGGPLTMGTDGMRIVVGRTIQVRPAEALALPDLDGPEAGF